DRRPSTAHQHGEEEKYFVGNRQPTSRHFSPDWLRPSYSAPHWSMQPPPPAANWLPLTPTPHRPVHTMFWFPPHPLATARPSSAATSPWVWPRASAYDPSPRSAVSGWPHAHMPTAHWLPPSFASAPGSLPCPDVLPMYTRAPPLQQGR
ncbi:hypothetical protein BaRGS_00004649, partial [Batillaria attramentaria]